MSILTPWPIKPYPKNPPPPLARAFDWDDAQAASTLRARPLAARA